MEQQAPGGTAALEPPQVSIPAPDMQTVAAPSVSAPAENTLSEEELLARLAALKKSRETSGSTVPENAVTPEQLRKALEGEVPLVGARMVHTEDFAQAGSTSDLLGGIQAIRLIASGGDVGYPQKTTGNIQIRVGSVSSGRLVSVAELQGMQTDENGNVQFAVRCEKRNYGKDGKLVSALQLPDVTTVSLDDLLEAQSLAAADDLRTFYANEPTQLQVAEAYIATLEEKILGKTDALDTVFAKDNLLNVQKAVAKEAEASGMITIADFDAYVGMRQQRLTPTDGTPLSQHAQQELQSLATMLKDKRSEGRTLLSSRDLSIVMISSMNPEEIQHIENSLLEIPGQISVLENTYVNGQEGKTITALERKAIGRKILELRRVHKTMTSWVECAKNPAEAQKKMKTAFDLYKHGLSEEQGIRLRQDFLSGDPVKMEATVAELINVNVHGRDSKDEESLGLLNFNRAAAEVEKKMGKGANFMLILLMLSTLGASGLAHG